jgi:hypothetical protein
MIPLQSGGSLWRAEARGSSLIEYATAFCVERGVKFSEQMEEA